MSRATPQLRKFAKRLIDSEMKANDSSEIKVSAAFRACEKLHPQLATLMGKLGFRALLSRSLVLGNAELAWLRAVHVKADGSLEGLDELERQVAPDEFSEGGVVLLAQLLGLLVAFIGESLVLSLVREVWPKISLDDLDFDKGGAREKTK
jgi:hypothetical protein